MNTLPLIICKQLAMQVKKTLNNNFRIIENWFHENGSQNDDFIIHGIKLPNSFEE